MRKRAAGARGDSGGMGREAKLGKGERHESRGSPPNQEGTLIFFRGRFSAAPRWELKTPCSPKPLFLIKYCGCIIPQCAYTCAALHNVFNACPSRYLHAMHMICLLSMLPARFNSCKMCAMLMQPVYLHDGFIHVIRGYDTCMTYMTFASYGTMLMLHLHYSQCD